MELPQHNWQATGQLWHWSLPRTNCYRSHVEYKLCHPFWSSALYTSIVNKRKKKYYSFSKLYLFLYCGYKLNICSFRISNRNWNVEKKIKRLPHTHTLLFVPGNCTMHEQRFLDNLAISWHNHRLCQSHRSDAMKSVIFVMA